MNIDRDTGLLAGVNYLASPNHDARPNGEPPSLIVIHAISLPPGEYGGPWIDQLFQNRLPATEHPYFETIHDLQVSAHLLIRRDGHVQQYVPFQNRAWHAGNSCYAGREQCNDFSIGIELEGSDADPFTDIQYLTLTECIAALIATYPSLSPERIVGHNEIAAGRKSDPGTQFEWGRLSQSLSVKLHSAQKT